MHTLTRGTRRYLQFDGLRTAPGLVHAVSTRGLDVGLRADGHAAQRAANRAAMARDLGLDPADLCCCAQVHEMRIARVTAAGPRGRLEGCDAVLTDVPGVPLMTFSADCPLILLYDPGRRVLGLVHASWRCTVARLTEQAVRVLAAEYGVRPADLRVGIGPGAGPCCYEVQADVYAAARDLPQRDAAFQRREGRLYFDLGRANLAQLAAAGVPSEHVELAGLCTLCHHDLLYSFRREKAGCGHFGLMAALRPEGATAPLAPPPR